MDIYQLAENLNTHAIAKQYSIAELPELRKRYLNKQRLPSKIFTAHTIKDNEDKYAFHHGGRDEIQFNVGEEIINQKRYVRYGLCFSLEPSPSLHHPVEDLQPIRKKFDKCIELHPEYFEGFQLWYYQHGIRSNDFKPRKIPDLWFQLNTFICLGGMLEKPLSRLGESDIDFILEQFDRLLPIYQFCVLNQFITRPKIFTRLTSNDNEWELPSPHRWKKENQGKKNIPFENQYGFGHEEWLLNPRYNIDGIQYGYIRGMERASDTIPEYDEVHLYTVKKENASNNVYYLGYIKNLEVIKDNEIELQRIRPLINKFKDEMFSEIQSINGDISGIVKFPFHPVVKFNIKDVHFLDEPVFQPNFDLKTYKRFQPYELSVPIEQIFRYQIGNTESKFVSGKANQKSIFNRKNRESSVTIEKLHNEIVNALEQYLTPEYNLHKKNISIETMRFYGNIADVVTKEDDESINIFEIKTSSSGRRNIRDAIAQLLDYALHSDTHIVNKLIVVSPAELGTNEIEFIKKLSESIEFVLEYYRYTKNASTKFLKQWGV